LRKCDNFNRSNVWDFSLKFFQPLEKLEEVGEEAVAHGFEVFHFLGGVEPVGKGEDGLAMSNNER